MASNRLEKKDYLKTSLRADLTTETIRALAMPM